MKVVLFCGGLGTRLREHSNTAPKPLVDIGPRPIIWHLMKYYAHFGHKEFILCLGFRGDLIKNYFLTYDECKSNDFTIRNGGRDIDLVSRDMDEWTVTFVDTGLNANVGQRLKAVESWVGDDEMFLANYSDGLSDLQLPAYVDRFSRSDAVGCFLSVRPTASFHTIQMDGDGFVESVSRLRRSDVWFNGGYFAFRREIFNYLGDGEDLVDEPFRHLASERKLLTCRHDGFWEAMDTFKDWKTLEKMWADGNRPWQVWDERH